MIGALDIYLLRRLVGTFSIVLLGIVGLAATLDVLASADRAIEESGGVGGLGVYALSRIPLITLKMAPIAALLSALISLSALARTSELSAAGALGVSQARVMRALAPAAIGLAAALFAVGEFAVPPAAEQLRAMGLKPFAQIARPTDAVWLRDGDDVVRIGRVSADENSLSDVTIFQRHASGLLANEIRAARAERSEAGWRLFDVEVLPSAASPAERGQLMDWPTSLGPKSYKTLSAHPQELPTATVWSLAENPGASPKPSFFYKLWTHRKLSGPISAALLLLLAAPFIGRLTRGRSMATPIAYGLIAGFVFFVFDNLALAAAESGAIGPLAGAWGPPLTLALAIFAGAAFQERPG